MAYRFFTFLVIVACLFAGCAESLQWSKKHPAYNKAPYTELALAGAQNAFVLTRTRWFASRLEVPVDSIQIRGTEFCSQALIKELKRAYTKLNVLPSNALANFAEESQKLDDRIFMRGKLPEQGIALKDSAQNTPEQILIIHEVIVGTDLKREDYFDFSLMHNESKEKGPAQNISAIVSYTLWDNIKQRPLFSAVDEIQHPVSTLKWSDLESLIQQMVSEIRKNLYQGAK
ncbi:MAG: hypothetical protein HUK20_11410 [Fibrobacter sp.]|nr:hypothetical protein [Fibrobacter sp.]